jgi:hypothetical protein
MVLLSLLLELFWPLIVHPFIPLPLIRRRLCPTPYPRPRLRLTSAAHLPPRGNPHKEDMTILDTPRLRPTKSSPSPSRSLALLILSSSELLPSPSCLLRHPPFPQVGCPPHPASFLLRVSNGVSGVPRSQRRCRGLGHFSFVPGTNLGVLEDMPWISDRASSKLLCREVGSSSLSCNLLILLIA